MDCVDIIAQYFDLNVSKYKKYIGQSLKAVVKQISPDYNVIPYKVCKLQNKDVILWESRRDKAAHVTIFFDHRFYYSAPTGIKHHSVLLKYKKMLRPKYIVRSGE